MKRRLPRSMVATLVLSVLAGNAAALELPDWTLPGSDDHPLLGTLWHGDGTQVTLEELGSAIGGAKHVAIGEIHSNPDHHRIQAAVISELAEHGRRPTIVFEMIPESRDADLQKFLDSGKSSADELGAVLEWDGSGWPDWTIYKPIAETALSHRLPMKAGGLDKEAVGSLARTGLSSLAPERQDALALSVPFNPDDEARLRNILFDGHCGFVPRDALDPMLLVQRARDGAMANAIEEAANSEGTVLIAGAGHVRTDWAVPAILSNRLPDEASLALGLVEVRPDGLTWHDYTESVMPYDFVLFTTRSETDDPCVALKERFKKHAAPAASQSGGDE
ncbi:MAG: ChaN family lipoprotein [Pseudomonadota bacterium]